MWLEKIYEENGQFYLSSIERNGVRSANRIDELPRINAIQKPNRVSIQTDFSNWQISSAKYYLEKSGFDSVVDEGHRVFSFEYQGLTYLVPAFVLMKAFFRPCKNAFKFLFRPNGLEHFCVPSVDDFSKINFLSYDLQRSSSTGFKEPLSWMWCFPSARRLWDSAYSFAQSGLISLELPIGTANGVFHGKKIENIFAVTRVHFIKINTPEFPYSFVTDHSPNIHFHDGVALVGGTVEISQSNIKCDENGKFSLTDDEWHYVQGLIKYRTKEKTRSQQALHMLTFLNAILEKMGNKVSWEKAQFPNGNTNLAKYYFREWSKNGQWEAVIDYLNRVRA
ncbi:transposase [Undibacterium sp.]|uniref:transposase n=1 Tax=Undibacterium sp. TaxID=1914977 RepID=UPI0025E4EECB|nr:transposase [Undibacterium sp.]